MLRHDLILYVFKTRCAYTIQIPLSCLFIIIFKFSVKRTRIKKIKIKHGVKPVKFSVHAVAVKMAFFRSFFFFLLNRPFHKTLAVSDEL